MNLPAVSVPGLAVDTRVLPAGLDAALRVRLHDGRTVRLPAGTWPGGDRLTAALGGGEPFLQVRAIDLAEAERHLIAWRHPLHLPDSEHPSGRPYRRPFGRLCFSLDVLGRPASVVVLASTVNTWVCKQENLGRKDCVDLARIGRADSDDGILRAMLRLTRMYLVASWPAAYPTWNPVRALVANSLPGTQSAGRAGDRGLYAFDGFERVRVTSGAKGGGTYGRPSKANAIGDGARGLWVYRYEQPIGWHLTG